VVYANGDVGVCELHKPLGNLREKSFREIWFSEDATELRRRIAAKECWCTTEVFLWSSIVYQPTQLVRAITAARAWEKPAALGDSEIVRISPGDVDLQPHLNVLNRVEAAAPGCEHHDAV